MTQSRKLRLNSERLEQWVAEWERTRRPTESAGTEFVELPPVLWGASGECLVEVEDGQGYTGCKRVIVTHDAFSPGESCPNCQDGTLYRLKEWGMNIRLVGQPPLDGTRNQKTDTHESRPRCMYSPALHSLAPKPALEKTENVSFPNRSEQRKDGTKMAS